MKEIPAFASAMTAHFGRVGIWEALRQGHELKDLKWRMHPAQVCSVTNLYVEYALKDISTVVASLDDFPSVRELAKKYLPQTFLSVPIQQDDTMRPDQVEVLDANGKAVCRIYALAVPNGFEVPR